MIVGEITGTVVCTQKDPSLTGKKMLIVQPVNIASMKSEGSPIVALDAVGAGIGELVMIVGGSSARLADGFSKVPVDQSIIAIIDTIEIKGMITFSKNRNE